MKIMSLVERAERKRLPEFQSMDQPTLDWICANQPAFDCQDFDKGLFRAAIDPPRAEWFLEPRMIDGLHGTRHALRVSLYARALATRLGLPEAERDALALAGLLHDVRRKNDKGDERHGARCAEWFLDDRRHPGLTRPFTVELTSAIAAAIRFHEMPYGSIDGSPEYAGRERIVDILKTADALDRYRLPKRKWWIDDACLKVKPPEGFKAFAFGLIVGSERLFLEGADGASAVARALADLTAR